MTKSIEKLRNIGIIAHIDAGKTTTTERVLFYTGTTHRMGDVDDGTTVTDFDPEEAARGITIYSAAVACRWQDYDINIIDTPGHVDFTAEVERSLRVLDGAVVIFSAVEGVEAQSETVWRQADRYSVPRLCFINKMDRIGAGFERTFQEICERLHANPVAVMIPLGEGQMGSPGGFEGIIDLVDMQALYFGKDDQGKTIERRPIPAADEARAQEWREKLLDAVTLLSDEAFAAYDATGDIPPEVMIKALRQGTLAAQIQPLFCGSSFNYVGVQPVLDGVIRYLPCPLDRPAVEGKNPNPKKGGAEVRRPNDKDPFCGLVFKIVADAHTELSFVRIYSGVMKARSRLLNPRTGDKEMITQMWKIQASDREKLEEAGAGDIVGVIGPKEVVTGDTLCDNNHPILLESIRFPETVISMAVEPDSSADRKKLEDVLKLLGKQDPTFSAKMSEETGQTIISGMGELHLEIIGKRILRDFHLKVRVHKPRVSYRETIASPVRATGVFDRATGAQPLFASVTVIMEPHDGERPVMLENKLKPGVIPAELTPLLEKALQEECRAGGSLGFPLVKLKLSIIDAETREGQTNDVAIQAAAALAIRNCLQDGQVQLLEPIMKIEIVTPDDFLGNITADLNARRAMIVNTGMRANLVILDAEAPLSAMFGYSTQVRSLSQGRASYSMEPLRYSPAPPEVMREMLGG